jgi:hypothetical protein
MCISASSSPASAGADPFAGALPLPPAGAASAPPLKICSIFGLFSETRVVGHYPLLFK